MLPGDGRKELETAALGNYPYSWFFFPVWCSMIYYSLRKELLSGRVMGETRRLLCSSCGLVTNPAGGGEFLFLMLMLIELRPGQGYGPGSHQVASSLFSS